ncbi:hypothetical protein EBR21_10570 [bacterium]|nr:hypothetical protein [bacterium]
MQNRNLFVSICTLILGNQAFGGDKKAGNDLVNFLSGSWQNVSFEISDGKDVKREEYAETMVMKSEHVLTITAHGFLNGKDVTKDMSLELHGNDIVMSQGTFKATGKREGNLYSLSGKIGDNELRFRLYTMGNKYVFHRETWKNGLIQQVDMSYLQRK